ncbi:hypothetical protein CTEN210_17673 [Chaetoceros tenuissimus]|uniref:Uncharacterized protein n=1 Tax=Chaetoceros tenuissimus TaxID=426638 RepID=A0AAD3DB01_9STRA|nr:hypothetical protein CTEN210_17673 [Chaetoceros tenuissimus]
MKNEKFNCIVARFKYNIRNEYLYAACQDAKLLKQNEDKTNRDHITFYNALLLGLQGELQSFIRCLQNIQNSLLKHPVSVASLYFLSDDIEEEKLERLRMEAKASFDFVSLEGALLAIDFHLLCTNDLHEATKLLEKIEGMPSSSKANFNAQIQGAKLWLDVGSLDDDLEVLLKKLNIDGLMALFTTYKRNGQSQKAVEVLDKILEIDGSFLPALLEKASLQLSLGELEEATKLIRSASDYSKNHIQVQYLSTLLKFLTPCKDTKRIQSLQTLLSNLEEQDASTSIWLKVSKTFSRVCGNVKGVKELALDILISRTEIELEVDSSVMMEIARQQRTLGKLDESLDTFQTILNIDENNVDAFFGLTLCKILSGHGDEARHELEFFEEMQDIATGDSGSLSLDSICVHVLLGKGEKSYSSYVESMQNLVWDEKEFHTGIDVALLLEVCHLILARVVPEEEDVFNKLHILLQRIVVLNPTLLESSILLCRLKVEIALLDEFDATFESSIKTCGHSIEFDLIKIHKEYLARQNRETEAVNLLEDLNLVLSQSFGVQNNVYFCYLKGLLLLEKDEQSSACKLFQKVLNEIHHHQDTMKFKLSRKDIAKCFEVVFEILKKNKSVNALKSILVKLETFCTEGSWRFMKLRSELLFFLGGEKKAISNLKLSPDSPYFVSAMQFKAELFSKMGSEEDYIECFQNILDHKQDKNARKQLADAYLFTGNVKRALEHYEDIIQGDCDNDTVTILTTTILEKGYTNEAIQFLSTCLKHNPQNVWVKSKLVKILPKDEAIALVETDDNIPVNKLSENDVEKYIEWQLTKADLYSSLDRALDCLSEVKSIVQQVTVDDSTTVLETITMKEAKCHLNMEPNCNLDIALNLLKKKVPTEGSFNVFVLLTSRLYEAGRYKECLQQINNIKESKEEFPLKMICLEIDCLMMLCELEQALQLCERIIKNGYYNANTLDESIWSRMILCLKRMGNEKGIRKLIEQLFKTNNLSKEELHFCVGKCKLLMSDPLGALTSFNSCRNGDNSFSFEASLEMIRMYLCLDRRGVSNQSETLSALKLLQGLQRQNPSCNKISVLFGYHEVSVGTGKTLHKAINRFEEILHKNDNYVPALLGLALAKMKSHGSKTSKSARNILKRISKLEFDPKVSEDFHRAYILLAKDYFERGKEAVAQTLLSKVLKFDKSNLEAWVLLGDILEAQGGDPKQLLEPFEKSFVYDKSSITAGYRLVSLYIHLNMIPDALKILPSFSSNIHFQPFISKAALLLRP